MIENFGAERIQSKKMRMYKGTVKKWQVLDDNVFDHEEIAKIQGAIRAPQPEVLDMYKEKSDKPMALPISNANAIKWRDEQLAIDTADFDPKLINYDREKKKKNFIERYEKPKELAEH